MNKAPQKLLVDTNVWLDWAIPGRDGHAAASRLVLEAISRGDTLLYPVHSLATIFYVLDQNFRSYLHKQNIGTDEEIARVSQSATWDCVENLREIATAVGADDSDVWLACKYRGLHGDLEDDLVLAAVERSKADYLITNDQTLAKHSPFATLSVDDALTLLEQNIV